jgi:carbamate kinase
MTDTAIQSARTPATPRRRSVVVALGNHALLGGAGPATLDVPRRNVAAAVDSIADLAVDHDVVVTHGSGLQSMIAYLLEQGLDETLPGRAISTLRMRSVVDADELRTIRSLVADGVLVICAGGGGMRVVVGAGVPPSTIETAVDRDLAAALLATCLGADALLMLTDVHAVECDWGTPEARPLRTVTPDDLRRLGFAADSMAPKVRAACRFVEATRGVAAIGGLADARALLNGRCGTVVQASHALPRHDGQAARDRLALVPAAVAAVSRGRSAAPRGRA